ncbi:tRNA (5-methylaminomethyl-2-thiouridine)(34)-methyltransferase MnmD [Croceivirga thetidis]|uniref:tRNA (5-methylaminomethyl-2-thiouridine)(34)-methyltransferase MnmD n=1 Tax=Croceivirga thetidis TaxID=2721623 RepID=A0ABX1GVE1_9FLAO|nr:tRNA (5-methylaminomethyl-2-thiouridine)(34)-methyltransferase MnmD [Croceivirga thetidis]
MKRKIIVTGDGSKTIQLEDWNEQYHSKHGAIQEAYHVFIKNGLDRLKKKEISILEIGFGTGLNAIITFIESQKSGKTIDYTGIEAFPVTLREVQQLNYTEALNSHEKMPVFQEMHACEWSKTVKISADFCLTKYKMKIEDVLFNSKFDLIYFDAFGPRVQPELWTEEIFSKMYVSLKPKGWLTTYSAKGAVRRALQSVGFLVERTEGPPGKREMLVAQKH